MIESGNTDAARRATRLRFHLSTAVIFSLWCGLAIGVWVDRRPWVFTAQRIEKTLLEKDIDLAPVSPDERRMVTHHVDDGFPLNEFPVVDLQDLYRELTVITVSHVPGKTYTVPLRFLDNDSLEFVDPVLKADYEADYYVIYTYKRRFPEWWWGHFYRPEVWVWLVLTVVLAWSGFRHFRGLRAPEKSLEK